MLLNILSRKQSLLTCLLLLCSLPLKAKELLILTEPLPPYQYVNEQGEVVGTMTEQVNRLLTLSGVEAEIIMMPWARAFETALRRPDTLIFSLLRNEEREQLLEWIAPLGTTETYLYQLSSKPEIVITELEQLKKPHIIAVKRDDITARLLQKEAPKATFIVQTNTKDNLKMLMIGRADLTPASVEQMELFCQDLNCSLSDFRPVIRLRQLGKTLYLAANKQTNAALLDKLKVAAKDL